MNSHSSLVGMKNGTVTLEDSSMVLHKTKHTLIPHDSAMMLLVIYPYELKSYVHTKTCITALFIPTKT